MQTQRRYLDKDFWSHLEGLVQPPSTCSIPNEKSGSGVPRAIDLYCWWAGITSFRGSIPSTGGFPTTMSFIAEGYPEAFQEWANSQAIPIVIPPAYKRQRPGHATKYFTFWINVRKLVDPTAPHELCENQLDVDEKNSGLLDSALQKVLKCSDLRRVQLGFPLGAFAVDATNCDDAPFDANVDSPDFTAVPRTQSGQSNSQGTRPSTRVVLGVIDDGAAFAHETLQRASDGKSRVEIVWRQSRNVRVLTPRFWTHPIGALQDGKFALQWYGAILRRERLQQAIDASRVGGAASWDLMCYSSLTKKTEFRRSLHSRAAHGAAVLTTFAGSTNAASVIRRDGADSDYRLDPGADDAAAEAPIIMVDLPYELTAISSGRWMPVAALDGVTFIVEQARNRYVAPDDDQVPIVINISSGSSAGCHDGKSLFESAISEILRDDDRLAITVAAGNSRLANAHAEIIIPPNTSRTLTVRVPPDKAIETYVEFWPEWATSAPNCFDSHLSHALAATVTSPMGDAQTVCAGSGEALLVNNESRPLAGMKFAANAVQSKDRPMALLVVAPTRSHEWRPVAPFGNWSVAFTNRSANAVKVKAWIERDEVVLGIRQPQSAHFVHEGMDDQPVNNWDDETQVAISRHDTTSNFANAQHAFTVAAGTGGRTNGYVSPYSGGGSGSAPSNRISFTARADRNAAAPGIPVYGAYGAVRYHMNGTSIAAPLAARWIANYLAVCKSRSAIEILAATSSPRPHPHLVDVKTGNSRVAAGEGKWFVDPFHDTTYLCLGKSE